MKLIIDIPEVVKHKVYAYGLSLCPSDKEQLIHAIVNGTPLEKIRAEIEKMDYLTIEDGSDGYDDYVDKYDVLQIIDKYKAESEVRNDLR